MQKVFRMWRSGLALLLAICLMVGVLPATALAAGEKRSYVSIGDSMANGYGLAGYQQSSDDTSAYDLMTGAGVYGQGAYPLQFEEYLTEQGYEVNHTKLAVTGMLAEDLLYLLGGREEFDDGWNGYKDYVGAYTDAELMPYMQNAITDADIITMGIGNTALGTHLCNRITEALGLSGASSDAYKMVDFEDAIAVLELDSEQYALVMQIYKKLEETLVKQVPAEVAQAYDLDAAVDLVAYNVATFVVNYRLLLQKVLDMNPDVEIVLIGLLNTTSGMDITGANEEVILPFGDMMDMTLEALNAYVAGIPAYLQSNGVAQNAKLYYAAPPAVCPVFGEMFGDRLYVYPTSDGHDKLAKAVIGAYKNNTVQDETQKNMQYALGEMQDILVNSTPEDQRKAYEAMMGLGYASIENLPSAYPQLDSKSTYVALGDGTAAPKGYAELLAARLQADYGIQGYTNYAANGNTVAEELRNIGSRADLAKADLITVGFGNITLLNNAIASAMGMEETTYDWESVVGQGRTAYVQDALHSVYAQIAEMGLDAETTAMLNSFVEGFAYGAVEYAVTLPKLIEAIREVNKDASIVILGQYNPMEGVVLKFGGATLDVTQYINYFVRAVAAHGVACCAVSGEAIFVEIPDVTTANADMEWTVSDLFKLLMKDFASLNPSDAGDHYIAQRILDSLHINEQPQNILWGDANSDGKVNLRDAIMVLQAANGKKVTIDPVAADVTGDGKVNLQDAIRILKRANGNTDPFPGEK